MLEGGRLVHPHPKMYVGQCSRYCQARWFEENQAHGKAGLTFAWETPRTHKKTFSTISLALKRNVRCSTHEAGNNSIPPARAYKLKSFDVCLGEDAVCFS
jgi:hypothetical protein